MGHGQISLFFMAECDDGQVIQCLAMSMVRREAQLQALFGQFQVTNTQAHMRDIEPRCGQDMTIPSELALDGILPHICQHIVHVGKGQCSLETIKHHFILLRIIAAQAHVIP